MKLITIVAALTYLTVKVQSQNLQHEQFPFPPQFQKPIQTDNSHYLPPENNSPLPYFPMKNVNNLQFPYLPPTGTKAPSIYPTQFPMMLSSALVPSFDDDDDDDDLNKGRINLSSPQPMRHFNQPDKNRTQNSPPQQTVTDIKEPRALPKPATYRHPIDRADTKIPYTMGTIQPPSNQTPANRRHMIVTADFAKDQSNQDQLKTASFQGLQYLQAPPGYGSSTTEIAIPILRLSNEMDLDGSFSYEALGADQTHYVQHSRMENMGTEKEEQVVEGSYSYVGDNGQTFTVHYVADSNGFRASGDHLPVPPPVPEIIQRAIQYNLAEEAKRPPHLKASWEEEAKENEKQKNYNNLFTNTPQPPLRNLFTGKQPEAFSYSYGQPATNPNNDGQNNNNLVAAASNQAPVKTVDFTQDLSQNKPVNIAPISPQITFLASQGAHLPSVNTNQQSISRMYSNVEKLPLPQLMNYEASLKDNEQESNKALWRWQYGANANNVSPNKLSISRSSGEGDDVMINFSDMTHEDYTNMIRSQLEPTLNGQGNNEDQSAVHLVSSKEQQNLNQYDNEYSSQQKSSITVPNSVMKPLLEQNTRAPVNFSPQSPLNTPATVSFPHSNDWYNKRFDNNNVVPEEVPSEQEKATESRKFISEGHPNIITQKHFIPKSQTVTQSYDYDESFFDVRKIKPNKQNNPKIGKDLSYAINQNHQENSLTTITNQNNNMWLNKEDNHLDSKILSTQAPSQMTTIKSNLKFTDFIVKETSTDFKPIISTQKESEAEKENIVTTTELNVQDIFENNIFLKNLVRSDKNIGKNQNKIAEETKPQIYNRLNSEQTQTYHNTQYQPTNLEPQQLKYKENIDTTYQSFPHDTHNINADPKADKPPNLISTHQKALNEVKYSKVKPLDMSEVLNYVALKNHFESGKLKPKSNPIFLDLNQRRELYQPNKEENKDTEGSVSNNKHSKIADSTHYNKGNNEAQIYNVRKNLNQQQQEELRGLIKNYKVLHRNNNQRQEQDNSLRKDINVIPLRMVQMQSPNLPPLGRAGPTVKAYLPPIYV